MKTTPEEAKRRVMVTKLEGVRASVRQSTHRSNGFKDLVLTVHFTLECEGRRASGRTAESRYNFIVDGQGNKIPVNGAEKNWATWQANYVKVRDAVLTAVYGTTNVANDPASNTAKYIVWKAKQLQRTLTTRVRAAVTSRENAEKITTAHRKARRKAMAEAIGDVLKKFPELRKQDLVLAFEAAKKERIVRDVMET